MNFGDLLPFGGNDTNVWNIQYGLSNEENQGFNNRSLNKRWLNQRLLSELDPLSQDFRSNVFNVENNISDATGFTVKDVRKRYEDPLFKNLIEGMVP